MPTQAMPGQQHPTAPRNGSTIRRRLIVVAATLTFALALTSTVLAAANAAGSGAPLHVSSLMAPVQPQAFLQISVNYAHEWVAGNTDPSASVAVTLADGTGTLKADAAVTADGEGGFFVGCEDWSSGQCPDIQTGDSVYAESAGMLADIDPVGAIAGKLDAVENTVSGTLSADWFPGTLDVRCEVWIDSGPEPITATVDPDGRSFTCDFDTVGWDLEPPQMVAVRYFEPDGDTVINVLDWPHMQVNYAHDWVGGNYELGHTFWLTVTESDGSTVKGTATADSVPGGGWGGDGFSTEPEHWSPEVPDIVPGDWVHFSTDDGFTRTIEVGTISGTLNLVADSVSGPIFASFPQTLPVECHPWGAWNAGLNNVQVKSSWAAANGSVPFGCSWAGEWDIVPGQDVAVLYIEPDGDMIIDVYREPAPYLRVEKWAQGQSGEGGNMQFTLRYWNEGDAPAEYVVLTDTLQGMAYLGDTSGLVPSGSGPGPIAWDVGTVDPGTDVQFDVFAAVTSVVPDIITNTVQIVTSNPFDQGEPEEKIAQWTGEVVPNNTHLKVGKGAWTGDPAPDTDVVFTVNVCNNGPTGSSEVTLTDLLHPAMALNDWWAQSPGWYEVPGDPGELIFALPSLPGGSCSEVYLRVHIAPEIEPGAYLTNTAFITATNDLEPGDNEAFWEGNTNGPHRNLYVNKWWNSGTLVPGGELRYGIGYGNDGNVPVESTRITDTFPVSTTFVRAWHSDPWGGYEFPPLIVTDEYAVWEIPGLENGFGGDFEVVLAVDPGAAPDTALLNTVEVSPLPGEDTYQDNGAEWAETLYPPGDPNLRVRKWHRWDGDGHLSYDVHFENVGTEPVGDVWVTDTLPLGTQWDEWWDLGFEWDRLLDFAGASDMLRWNLAEVRPGESGWLYFGANLDEAGAPARWYTNTVEIAVPSGDPSPGDNVFEDIAFSGGEVRSVEFWINKTGPSSMWGAALPGSTVTVTTPHTQVLAWADPGCGGCWNIDDAGLLSPGDVVDVIAGKGLMPVSVAIPVPLDAEVDTAAGTVYGQIGGWNERPVGVHGNWPDGYQEVPSDPAGNFLASYPEIPRGADGYVRIVDEIDYAQVVFHRPFWALDLILTVDYDHDWVGAEYEAGHTIYLTVTDDLGAVKATAAVDTPPESGWWSTNWDQWSPQQPDIVPGDWVYGLVDGGTYTTEVGVGTIDGQVDVDADIVSGTLDIAWLTQPVLVSCEIHEEMGSAISFPDVNPKGGSFECDFSTAPEPWDILPGHNVAVNYTEPDGDRVQAHPANPAPHLRVEKWSDSQPAAGGNMAFTVQYRNEGGLPAEGVVLTDTLEGMTYLGDTSGLPVSGSDPVVWDVGTLEPGDWIQFTVYAQVTAPAPDPVTNTLQIATSNPFDQGDPGEKVARWAGEVVPNNTHLNVGKWAWTVGPAADTDVVFTVNVCNNGPTGSSEVTLTDVLTTTMALVDWWSQSPGWTEVYSDTGELTVALPSLPGHSCSEVYLRAHVAPGIEPGSYLTNTAFITATNDLEADDNQATWDGWVQPPRTNLYVDKRWAGGQLVPGGQLHYDVRIENSGNQPVGEAIVFTDTLPAYTAFDSLWLHDQDGPYLVTPTVVGPDYVVWELPGLDNGYSRRFELVLNVDGGARVGAVLTNTVEISCLPGEDCGDNASTWVETLYDHGPNLRVRKSGSWDDWGEDTRRASYWVNIENIGDQPVSEALFTDTYPELMLLDGPVEADWGRVRYGGDDPASHTFTATIEWLGPGESTALKFGAIVPGAGPLARGLVLTNTAEVIAVPGEPTYDDNVGLAVLTTGPDLFVEKTWIGGQLLPGQLITYSLVFGNDRLSYEWWWGVQGTPWLTDTIPADTAFVTSTLRGCEQGMWCAFPPISSDGTHLTWQLAPPLYFGASHWNEIHLTLRVLETIEAYNLLTNTAEIASDQPISDAEPYLGNNYDEHVAMAMLPRFEVGKAYAGSRVAGTAVTYTLSVTNTGNSVGTNVVLSDVLPAGLTYGGSDGTFDGTAIHWEIPSIAAEGGLAGGWFSATLGCALDPVANDDYRVVGSDQGVGSLPGPVVAFDVVEPSISLALTHTVGHVVAGDTVYVTATATTDGSALSYTWDWGEGPVVGGLNALHAYARDGSYTVVLTATDTCGYSDAVSAKIDVAAPDLVPSFDYYPVPAHVMVEWPVVFTDTTTTDGPAIVAWHWDFGDDASGTGAAVSHAYLEAGTYTVTLTVTDALGYSAQHAAPGLVTVSDCVPLSSVSLAYAPLGPLVNVPLVLTATIAPPDATGPIMYEWVFGDGITDTTTVPSVVHTYAASGLVEVSVTATNRCTLTGVSDQQNIIVSPRRIYLPLVLRNH